MLYLLSELALFVPFGLESVRGRLHGLALNAFVRTRCANYIIYKNITFPRVA